MPAIPGEVSIMSIDAHPAGSWPSSRRPPQLRALLTAALTLLALLITLVVSYTIGSSGVERVEREIGRSLAMLADQMQDKLDRGLFERAREISNMAEVLTLRERPLEGQIPRRWLEQMQSTFTDYAWLGMIGTDGRVIVSTQGVMQGESVAGETWFRNAFKGVTVGDVHDAGRLAELLPEHPGDTMRFIDVAAPILQQGRVIGILGAHLNWSWAREVQDSLFGSTSGNPSTDVLVINKAGTVLLGPPEIVGKALSLERARGQSKDAIRYAVETWSDGVTYLSGYAESDGYRQFAGLGWSIVVRQKAAEALAPATNLQRLMVAWGAAFMALSGGLAWALAGRFTTPLLRLATTADQVRRGEPAEIPHVGGYAEAEMLSDSLRTLVAELRNREARLSDLNVSLERQVADRTRKLEDQNLQLAAAKEEAESATRSKSRFLAAASHDLRQPLHALTLFARALSRRVEGAEAKGLVAQTEQALASLKEMFDALLNVSRLDAGLIQPTLQDVSLAELIGRLSAGFKAEAEHRGLSFRALTVDAVVRTDPVLLETIVRNLISNALKFTRQGGVLLACRRHPGSHDGPTRMGLAGRPCAGKTRIAIEVYDTGPGITPTAQGRVFQEFERSQRTATGANDGLGLGLSIVQRYAHLLDIDIDLTSRPGRGSRFRVLMPELVSPARQGTQADRVVGRGEGQPGGLHKLENRRILVLDDEPLIVESLARDLTDRGNHVLRAGSPAEAEAKIIGQAFPDGAVIDIDLSASETGPEFISRIERKFGRALPTLVLTGATDAERLAELVNSGRRWLTKPADPDMIAAVLGELIDDSERAQAAPALG